MQIIAYFETRVVTEPLAGAVVWGDQDRDGDSEDKQAETIPRLLFRILQIDMGRIRSQ